MSNDPEEASRINARWPCAMILAETSIMIDALRPQFQAVRLRLSLEAAVICGVSKAELMQGIRSPQDRQNLMNSLAIYPSLVITEAIWEATGDLLSQLSAAGTRVPFPDAAQAAVAIEYNIPIWTKDIHFQFVQAVAPKLMLFVP